MIFLRLSYDEFDWVKGYIYRPSIYKSPRNPELLAKHGNHNSLGMYCIVLLMCSERLSIASL